MKARLRRASEVTSLVYVVRTLFALALAWPLFAELTRALDTPQPLPPERAAATLLLGIASRRGADLGLSVALVLGAQAVLAPFLMLCWLHAMTEACSVQQSLGRALRDYPRALWLALLALLGAVALFVGLASSVALVLPYAGSPLAEQLLRAPALLAAALGALWLTTVYELACSELVCGARRTLLALRSALRRAGGRRLLTRAGSCVLTVLLLALAEVLARKVSTAQPELLVLVPQQLLIFGSVCVRAAWLASTLDGTRALPA